jgi:fumarylacetoacetase
MNHTHDPAITTWIAPSKLTTPAAFDFPIQNLPIAVVRRKGSDEVFRGGVAIQDQVVDLAALFKTNLVHGAAQLALEAASQSTLNGLMSLGPTKWHALRHALFALLESDATESVRSLVRPCLIALTDVEYALPVAIGDYTDFYTSIHHARNVGQLLFPENPLTPNFQWLPIAYHGRASSVVLSGYDFHRPWGQAMAPGATAPSYGPCARLDFELEMGFFVGTGNPQGRPISLANAEQHIFGMCLLNDWSARDHQFWEMAPLGPFLGKNFCTSISPWIVTMEALEPFRMPFNRPSDEPQPLSYLDHEKNRHQGAIDVHLEVTIESEMHRIKCIAPSLVTKTSFKHQYWTIAQMLAQHTVGGCNMQAGDLLGTGTVSGPTANEAGAIVELSKGGREPITLQNTGEQRAFLHDGDVVRLQGWCEKPGAARIGFGECCGMVLPALADVLTQAPNKP